MFNPHRVLRYVIITGLFLALITPLVVSNSLFFPYITGKAFFFRIVVEICFALWLFLIWREPRSRPRLSPILWSLGGLAAVGVLATALGANPYRSFWSNFERMDGLISQLHLLGYFLILVTIIDTEKLWRRFFHFSLAVSAVVGCYALAQLGLGSAYRLDATLGNPIYLAVYALFHIFLCLILARQYWREVWWRAGYLALALFQIFILYRTATRGALLGLVGGLFVTGMVVVIARWREVGVRRWGASLVILLLALVGALWLGRESNFVQSSPVLSRFTHISLGAGTEEARLTIWRVALRGVVERPILGWGPENFGLVFNKYYEPALWRQEQWFDRSHNIFLDWLVDAGVVGLLVYLSLFVAALLMLWRRTRWDVVVKSLWTGLLAAYAINNFFVFDNLTSSIMFLSVLGYIHYCSVPRDQTRDPLPWGLSATEWSGAGVLLVGLISVIYWGNWRPLAANYNLISALRAIPENQLTSFQKVFSTETFGNREASEQLGALVASLAKAGSVPEPIFRPLGDLSLKQIARESELSPEDVRPLLLLGTMQLNLGDVAGAVKTLTRAADLAPKKQTILMPLAVAQYAASDSKAALATAERAFALDERFPEARRFYALNLISAGQLGAADKLLDGDIDFVLDDRFVNAYASIKRYDRLLKLWQERVERRPNDLQSRFSLAATYLVLGQGQRAIETLKAVVKLDPRLGNQVDKLVADIRAGKNPLQSKQK